MPNRTAIVTWWMCLGLLCAAWAYAPAPANSQEKKNLRVVFTGLAWNSELPFRVALARGFFRAQELEIQPIFVRGGPAALAALSSGEWILPKSAAPKRLCAAGLAAWMP